MASGSAASLDGLPRPAWAIVEDARRAVLSTVDARDRPHSVPVVFAVIEGEIVTPIDEKPKSGKQLARVRNIERHAAATVLFDRWDEDWGNIGWVIARGTARLERRDDAIAPLKQRYPQYDEVPIALTGTAVVVTVERATWWTLQ